MRLVKAVASLLALSLALSGEHFAEASGHAGDAHMGRNWG